MSAHRRFAIAAALLCLPAVGLGAWTEAERASLARRCMETTPQIANAPAGDGREVCACVVHVITVNFERADDLPSRGLGAAADVLETAIEPCVAARGAVKDMPAETPAERRAHVARLRQTGRPLPQLRGWDADSSDRYLTDCEAASRRSWPDGSETARRVYCRCTLSTLGTAFETRTECEAAFHRMAQGASSPQESWKLAAHMAACTHFAQQRGPVAPRRRAR